MVLLSSRLGLFAAAPSALHLYRLHPQEHPFYQRYGVNLPSSLTRDHSSTLASSACLPVSVCGTVTQPPPFAGISCLFRPRCLADGVATSARIRLSIISPGVTQYLPTGLNGARLAALPAAQHPTFVKR